MAFSTSLSFTVKRHEPELIVPAIPTPREIKRLSDIDDQQGLRFQLPLIMFYQNNPFGFALMRRNDDAVRVIRDAISKALVFYYPLAGRLVEGPNRKLMVDCSGEGLIFIEADANVSLEQLGDTIQPPYPYLEELLYDVPGSGGIIGCPLLLIQVTRLKCGGHILALRLNHVICDTFGLTLFLNTAAEIAQGRFNNTTTPPPPPPTIWERHIFNARDSPRITCTHHEFDQEVSNSKASLALMDCNNMIHKSFFFGLREIRAIKAHHLPPHLRNCSVFDLITACLWRCRTVALELDPEEEVRVSCMIGARGKNGLHVPSGYYGNAFAFCTAVSKAGPLCESPLDYALRLVQKAKSKMSLEYIQSLADLMVLKGRPKYTTHWNYLVADTTKVGLGDIDFGWGKSVYGGPAGAISLISFYVKFKNSKGEEGTVVPIWLPESVMERFQEELERFTSKSVEDFNNAKPVKAKAML